MTIFVIAEKLLSITPPTAGNSHVALKTYQQVKVIYQSQLAIYKRKTNQKPYRITIKGDLAHDSGTGIT